MSKWTIVHGKLREVSDEELMHWKYISKKWVGDRWVYTYDWNKMNNDIGITKLKAYNQAKKNEENWSRARDYNVINAGQAAGYIQKHSKKNADKSQIDRASNLMKTHVKKAKISSQNLEKAKKATKKAHDAYIGTPISYFTHPNEAIKKLIARGKNAMR